MLLKDEGQDRRWFLSGHSSSLECFHHGFNWRYCVTKISGTHLFGLFSICIYLYIFSKVNWDVDVETQVQKV
jgi:hypothetical protein